MLLSLFTKRKQLLSNISFESDTIESAEKVKEKIKGYIPVLEGFRGMACLLVFFSHFYSYQFSANSNFFGVIYNQILPLGWCGVDAFFVLSGFLITGILLDNKEDSHYFTNFYGRRILRIFPLYYFALLLVFVILRPIFSQDETYLNLENLQSWYWFYLQNWQATFHGLGSYNILSHFWSLAVEEQFYLFWPLIIYLVPKRFLGGTIAFFIVFPIVLRNILLFQHLPSADLKIIYVNTFCRVDSLVIGATIAFIARSEYWLPWLIRSIRLLLALSFCGLAAIFISQGELGSINPLVQSFGYSLLAIFFGSLLVSSLSLPENHSFVQILSWSPLRQLGRISYGFYVYHFPILFLFRDSLTPYTINLTHSYWISELLLLLFFGTAIATIAFISWYGLEQPILKLKKYFPTKPYNGNV